jgi:hypothetical protein
MKILSLFSGSNNTPREQSSSPYLLHDDFLLAFPLLWRWTRYFPPKRRLTFNGLCRLWGRRSYSWLRHHASSREVAGSIPVVIAFFNWPNPSSRINSPEDDSASNGNEYQESSWRVKGSRCVRLTTSPLRAGSLEIVAASTSHNPTGLHGLLQG